MKSGTPPCISLKAFPDQRHWLDALKVDFLSHVTQAISLRGVAHVALSGGSTPLPFYELLAKESALPSEIVWWLGDERWVPKGHKESNELMIQNSLGKKYPNWPASFRSWYVKATPDECAEAYEAELLKEVGTPPVIDICLLGLGTDGHTASLFPGTTALDVMDRYASVNIVPQLNATRLTLTYPTLNLSRNIWFLVKGAEKAPMIERLIARDPSLPSTAISKSGQVIYWAR